MPILEAGDCVDSPVTLSTHNITTLRLLVPLSALDLALALDELGLALRHLVRLEQRRASVGARSGQENVGAVTGSMSYTTARETGRLVCAQVGALLATFLGALGGVAGAFWCQLRAAGSQLVRPPPFCDPVPSSSPGAFQNERRG